jgi:hypothetical protein
MLIRDVYSSLYAVLRYKMGFAAPDFVDADQCLKDATKDVASQGSRYVLTHWETS